MHATMAPPRTVKLFKPVRRGATAVTGCGDEATCCSICLDALAPSSLAVSRPQVCALRASVNSTQVYHRLRQAGTWLLPLCRYNLIENRPANPIDH